jgi:hypothetical protein
MSVIASIRFYIFSTAMAWLVRVVTGYKYSNLHSENMSRWDAWMRFPHWTHKWNLSASVHFNNRRASLETLLRAGGGANSTCLYCYNHTLLECALASDERVTTVICLRKYGAPSIMYTSEALLLSHRWRYMNQGRWTVAPTELIYGGSVESHYDVSSPLQLACEIFCVKRDVRDFITAFRLGFVRRRVGDDLHVLKAIALNPPRARRRNTDYTVHIKPLMGLLIQDLIKGWSIQRHINSMPEVRAQIQTLVLIKQRAHCTVDNLMGALPFELLTRICYYVDAISSLVVPVPISERCQANCA